MADNELKVIVKAKELAVHSFRLTSNCNRLGQAMDEKINQILSGNKMPR